MSPSYPYPLDQLLSLLCYHHCDLFYISASSATPTPSSSTVTVMAPSSGASATDTVMTQYEPIVLKNGPG